MSSCNRICSALSILIASWCAGCGSQPAVITNNGVAGQTESTHATGAVHVAAQIVVVGDDTAAEVSSELRKRGFTVSEDAASVDTASLVVVAEDAPNGVREAHRQLAQKLGRNDKATVLWLFTRMSLINDRDLMDLMQQEVQDLLQQNGFSSERVRFAVDTEQTTVDANTLKGWTSLAQYLIAGGI